MIITEALKAGVHLKAVFDVDQHGVSVNISFTFQTTPNPSF